MLKIKIKTLTDHVANVYLYYKKITRTKIHDNYPDADFKIYNWVFPFPCFPLAYRRQQGRSPWS